MFARSFFHSTIGDGDALLSGLFCVETMLEIGREIRIRELVYFRCVMHKSAELRNFVGCNIFKLLELFLITSAQSREARIFGFKNKKKMESLVDTKN